MKIRMIQGYLDTTVGEVYEIASRGDSEFSIIDDKLDYSFFEFDKEGILFEFVTNRELELEEMLAKELTSKKIKKVKKINRTKRTNRIKMLIDDFSLKNESYEVYKYEEDKFWFLDDNGHERYRSYRGEGVLFEWVKTKIVMIGEHVDTTIGEIYEVNIFSENGITILDDRNERNTLRNEEEGVLFHYLDDTQYLFARLQEAQEVIELFEERNKKQMSKIEEMSKDLQELIAAGDPRMTRALREVIKSNEIEIDRLRKIEVKYYSSIEKMFDFQREVYSLRDELALVQKERDTLSHNLKEAITIQDDQAEEIDSLLSELEQNDKKFAKDLTSKSLEAFKLTLENSEYKSIISKLRDLLL